MRRFFLFCLFVICFLSAGFLKENIFNVINENLPQNNSYLISDYSKYSEIEVKELNLFEMININKSGEVGVSRVDAFDLSNFSELLDLKIYSCEEVSNRLVLTGFSSKLKKFVYVSGKRVNVQVSICSDFVKVGSPLILGSF